MGGVKTKVPAAHRAGLTTVLLPKNNDADLDDLPEEVLHGLKFIPLERIDDALDVVLHPHHGPPEK